MTTDLQFSIPTAPRADHDARNVLGNFARMLPRTRESLGLDDAVAPRQSSPSACHSRSARSMSRSCSSQACSR